MRWVGWLAVLAACSGPARDDRQDVLRACVLGASCLQPGTPLSGPVGRCVLELEPSPFSTSLAAPLIARHFAGCGATATDCASFRACLSYGRGPEACDGGPRCDGTVLVACDPRDPALGAVYSLDCTEVGLVCRTGAAGSVCADETPCTGALDCEGTVNWICNADGHRTPYDCGWRGRTCGSYESGMVMESGCLGTGPECTEPRCEGTVIVECSGGREDRTDCALVGSRCEVGPGGALLCARDVAECAPSDPDTCDGDSLRTCVGGRRVSLACTQHGFSRCDGARGVCAD